MEQATHERLSRGEVLAPGSERAFGLVMAAVSALISLVNWWPAGTWWPWLGGAALLFLACALGYPRLLKPLNRAWFRFGLLLHAVINPIVMGVIFFVAVTPTGWIMRARGNDLLRLRRDPERDSYWVERTPPGPAPESFKDQF